MAEIIGRASSRPSLVAGGGENAKPAVRRRSAALSGPWGDGVSSFVIGDAIAGRGMRGAVAFRYDCVPRGATPSRGISGNTSHVSSAAASHGAATTAIRATQSPKNGVAGVASAKDGATYWYRTASCTKLSAASISMASARSGGISKAEIWSWSASGVRDAIRGRGHATAAGHAPISKSRAATSRLVFRCRGAASIRNYGRLESLSPSLSSLSAAAIAGSAIMARSYGRSCRASKLSGFCRASSPHVSVFLAALTLDSCCKTVFGSCRGPAATITGR